MITVVLPAHLRILAKVQGDVHVEVQARPTVSSVLDALEARYPALGGTLRDHVTRKRRAYVRFFACGEDISLDSPEHGCHVYVRLAAAPSIMTLCAGVIAAGTMRARPHLDRTGPTPSHGPGRPKASS